MIPSHNGDLMFFSYGSARTKQGKVFVSQHDDHMAKEIAEGLEIKIGTVDREDFANNEVVFTVQENVRNRDVYVLFRPNPNKLNEDIFSYLILLDAFNVGSARKITAVIPNLPYSRQDQTNGKRQPVTARLFADLLAAAGASHVITLGLHADQIEGFYRRNAIGGISIDALRTTPIVAHYLQTEQTIVRLAQAVGRDIEKAVQNPLQFLREYAVLVAPDGGGLRRTNRLKRKIDPEGLIPVGLVPKERTGTNEATTGTAQGDYRGKVAIITEDILDTAGTLFGAASALKSVGIAYVLAHTDHLLGNSKPGQAPYSERLLESDLDEVVCTNTVQGTYGRIINDLNLAGRTTLLSVSPLLTEAIRGDQLGETVRDIVNRVDPEKMYQVVHERRA